MTRLRFVVVGALASSLVVVPSAVGAVQKVRFEVVGRTPAAGAQGAGSVAYYAPSKSLYVVNRAQARVDVFDLSDPASPVAKTPILVHSLGSASVPSAVATSTACGGIVAVTVPDAFRTETGTVVFLAPDGSPKYPVAGAAGYQIPWYVGRQPKHLAFMPGRHRLLVASEAPPGNNGNDREGSVSVLNWTGCKPTPGTSGGATSRRWGEVPIGQATVPQNYLDFRLGNVPTDPDVRRFALPAGGSADLEPEYVTGAGARAYVSFQENNAIGVLEAAPDANRWRWLSIRSVGFTDRGAPGNEFDSSDTDGVRLRAWPNVFSMRQPSAIAAYQVEGKTYVVAANQGAPRDYDFQTESHRVKGLPLDPAAFPKAATLQKDANLGRLNVSTLIGDTDKDGDYDELYAFGGRSISILDADATPIWDSGSAIEQWTAANEPGLFDRGNTAGSPVDSRSDDMGPEPKAITTGLVSGRRYAFLGTAQQGSLFAWDLSDKPGEASIAGHINTRDTDLAPDAIRFIPSYESPNGRNLVLLTSARTGTTTIYAVKVTR